MTYRPAYLKGIEIYLSKSHTPQQFHRLAYLKGIEIPIEIIKDIVDFIAVQLT